MKKLSLLAIAALITSIAGAQVQFGVKAGLNLGNLSVSPAGGASYSLLPSLNAGGLVYCPLISHFGLQPELMYSGQGAKGAYAGVTATTALGYVSVPILFKYKDPSGFFAEIGPQLGILLTAKTKGGGTTTDVKEHVKSTDICGVLGIGYLTSLNLGIDARYNLGFTNINKDGDGTVKNNVIQLSVFYMFGESRKK